MVTKARLKDDGTVVEILRDGSELPLARKADWAKIDATTEEEIAAQIAEDDAEAMRDAAAYARRVRRKGRSVTGCICQTHRCSSGHGPQLGTGPARAYHRSCPETALQALAEV